MQETVATHPAATARATVGSTTTQFDKPLTPAPRHHAHAHRTEKRHRNRHHVSAFPFPQYHVSVSNASSPRGQFSRAFTDMRVPHSPVSASSGFSSASSASSQRYIAPLRSADNSPRPLSPPALPAWLYHPARPPTIVSKRPDEAHIQPHASNKQSRKGGGAGRAGQRGMSARSMNRVGANVQDKRAWRVRQNATNAHLDVIPYPISNLDDDLSPPTHSLLMTDWDPFTKECWPHRRDVQTNECQDGVQGRWIDDRFYLHTHCEKMASARPSSSMWITVAQCEKVQCYLQPHLSQRALYVVYYSATKPNDAGFVMGMPILYAVNEIQWSRWPLPLRLLSYCTNLSSANAVRESGYVEGASIGRGTKVCRRAVCFSSS